MTSTDIFCLYVVAMGLALQAWYWWVSMDMKRRQT